MTNREFLNAVINAGVSDEVTDFAIASIEKMDKRNADRSSKPSKKALENAPIKEAIVAFLGTNGEAIAADIATGVAIKPAQASALCVQLVKDGRLTSRDFKVPKKGKVKAYSLAEVTE